MKNASLLCAALALIGVGATLLKILAAQLISRKRVNIMRVQMRDEGRSPEEDDLGVVEVWAKVLRLDLPRRSDGVEERTLPLAALLGGIVEDLGRGSRPLGDGGEMVDQGGLFEQPSDEGAVLVVPRRSKELDGGPLTGKDLGAVDQGDHRRPSDVDRISRPSSGEALDDRTVVQAAEAFQVLGEDQTSLDQATITAGAAPQLFECLARVVALPIDRIDQATSRTMNTHHFLLPVSIRHRRRGIKEKHPSVANRRALLLAPVDAFDDLHRLSSILSRGRGRGVLDDGMCEGLDLAPEEVGHRVDGVEEGGVLLLPSIKVLLFSLDGPEIVERRL